MSQLEVPILQTFVCSKRFPKRLRSIQVFNVCQAQKTFKPFVGDMEKFIDFYKQLNVWKRLLVEKWKNAQTFPTFTTFEHL